jgi:hypothetical protein
MKAYTGISKSADAEVAVREATAGIPTDIVPQIVFAFASTQQDADIVARAIASRFPGSLVTGCTTAGEVIDGDHANGSLVVAAVVSPEVRWSLQAVRGVKTFDEAAAQSTADALFAGLEIKADDADPSKHFCLTFIDGLSMKEERVVSLMADALAGLPLLGGSAGDDLAFKETRVFCNGEALRDGAIFVLGETDAAFEIVKHQHYTTTPRSVVITKADTSARRVYEIDGYPALEAYARALGLTPDKVTNEVTFMNPVTFVCNGEIYVRSIQRVEPDGSIIFYCGVEEGMVLSIGGHEEMRGALARDLDALTTKHGRPELFIACNCILRALEAKAGEHHAELASTLQRNANHAIGFDTYGEQLHGLHINQTLVGLALFSAKEGAAA